MITVNREMGSHRGYRLVASALFAIACLPTIAQTCALADTLELGTGLNLTWNPAAQPGGSSPIVIPVYNESSMSTEQLFGWGIGLKVIPVDATGTLSINTSSIAYPTNEVIGDPSPSSGPQVMQAAGVTVISSSSASYSAYTVPSSGDNLVQLSFTSSNNAAGEFELVAVNDAGGNYTQWTDQNADNQAFSNSPFANGSMLDLGMIDVLAVPEPSVLLLAGLGSLGIAGYRRHYRRRLHGSGHAAERPISQDPSLAEPSSGQ